MTTGKKSGLTIEDGKLLKGALTFKDRNVGDVMTPLSHCYFLSEDAVLDKGVIMDILTHGHTRVPVYRGEKQNVIAILFCKDLLGIGFERAQVGPTRTGPTWRQAPHVHMNRLHMDRLHMDRLQMGSSPRAFHLPRL